MSFKTILIHVESTPQSDARVQLATDLAYELSARLVGIGGCAPAYIDNMSVIDGPTLQLIMDQERNDLAKAEAAFRRISSPLGDAVGWRSEQDYPNRVVEQAAAGADLIVLTQGRGPHASTVDPGEMALLAGLPVLVVPKELQRVKLKQIVVAWKNTREARRAITDALPLLCAAEEVILVEVSASGAASSESAHLAVERLKGHGVQAASESIAEGPGEVGDELIAYATDLGADLIVAGAYGHSRLREWYFGGATHGLLQSSPLPVLFSH